MSDTTDSSSVVTINFRGFFKCNNPFSIQYWIVLGSVVFSSLFVIKLIVDTQIDCDTRYYNFLFLRQFVYHDFFPASLLNWVSKTHFRLDDLYCWSYSILSPIIFQSLLLLKVIDSFVFPGQTAGSGDFVEAVFRVEIFPMISRWNPPEYSTAVQIRLVPI